MVTVASGASFSSGVAGDDDRFHLLRPQKTGDVLAVPDDGLLALRTVRHAGRVAEVNDALVRQLAYQLAHDSQSAEPGVEDSYGRIAARHQAIDPVILASRFSDETADPPAFGLE